MRGFEPDFCCVTLIGMKHLLPAFTFTVGVFLSAFFFRPAPQEPLELPLCPVCPKGSGASELAGKEYYEKAFLLFLASIGARITEKEKSQLQQLVANPTKYVEANPYATKDGIEIDPGLNIKKEIPAEAPHASRAKELPKKQLELKNIQAQAQTFRLKDPGLFYARSHFIQKWSPQIQAINGDFSGKLYRLDKDPMEIEDVEIHVSFVVREDEKIDGEFQLLLSRNGEVYSNNRGSGGNGDIKIHPEDPSTIIIEASPNSFFHGKVHDLSLLNYYYDGKHVGVAHIHSN